MKKYRTILLIWIFLTLLCSMPLMGSIILISSFFAIGFLIKKFIIAISKKITWKDFSIVTSIILCSYTITGTIHYCRYLHARQYAENVVQQVVDYKKKNNKYPEISEVYIEDKLLTEGKVLYTKNTEEQNTEPYLFYMDTFMMYASYHYNFKENIWEYVGD